MKKFVFSAVLSLFFLAGAMAQDFSSRGTLDYNGVKYASTQYEYNSTPEVVSSVIQEALAMKGFKPSSSRRGTLVYRNVVLPYTSGDRIVDAIFEVSQKSRSEKDKTIVQVITAQPNAIPDDRPKKGSINPDAVVTEAAASGFYAGILGNVNIQEHSRQVGIQQDAVKSSEKKLEDLINDQKRLEDRLTKLQKEIEDNKKAQEDQTRTIEAEKQKLEIMQKQNN